MKTTIHPHTLINIQLNKLAGIKPTTKKNTFKKSGK